MKRGFTLVELLVVIAILAIIGGLILTIFTRSLRGTNKSQIVSAIKQNGQSVLEMMDKAIRSSDNIVCVSNAPSPGPTLVIVKDGIYTRYRFIAPLVDANGYIAQDAPIQPATGQEADIKIFTENVCSDPLQGQNILTDVSPGGGVSVNDGSFSKDQKPGFKDSLTIGFTLKPGVEAPQAVSGQIDPSNFQTTIQLR